MKKFLIIQTAFIGDVILATAVVEKLISFFQDTRIDFLVRKGNESLLQNNPHLNEVLIWDKKKNKFLNLLKISNQVRAIKYDYIINLHRFGSSGFVTFLSGAKNKIGFDKNPFSFCYTKTFKHEIGNGKHEVDRNQQLISELTDSVSAKPKLYPTKDDFEKIDLITKQQQFICIAPASVWFTKQFPKEKWIEFINKINQPLNIFLIGAPSDFELCEEIKSSTKNNSVINLAGRLSFLESAALMKIAKMNYVNDSAPMHICSAMNAKVTVVFCSTVPAFGFGPLSDNSIIVETKEKLDCRPCGLHGFKACPKGHFKCVNIDLLDYTDYR